ncbi:thymidylate synthase [Bacillus phage Eldridge]|uniref:thymidylate synthase n=1 Tax=Bacillus phage Eldridge TaxID=1776293 RepID=A0A120HUN6_9CAUD|nr:thymidylate synthase [Bacillus phage Eldridge]AMB18610.1 thymidylate synthase [Bacillus phage Eldridge]
MHADLVYKQLVEKTLLEGEVKGDRTGTGTVSLFGEQIEFNLKEGFPLLTTKQLSLRVIFEELRWFLSGSTNLKDLLDNDVHIWTDDAYRFYKEKGGQLSKEEFVEMVKREGFDMGPIYGKQFREWGGEWGEQVDQVANVIESLKNDPDSRRHMITMYNPTVLKRITLPPCHMGVQFYMSSKGLCCKMIQRSADLFLGEPFNIASYALFTHMIAKMIGTDVYKLIISLGDGHVYLNHLEQTKLQLSREPRPMPQLNIKTVHKNIEDYTFADIELTGYRPHPAIKGKLSVGL